MVTKYFLCNITYNSKYIMQYNMDADSRGVKQLTVIPKETSDIELGCADD
jgi:hypothetical protein